MSDIKVALLTVAAFVVIAVVLIILFGSDKAGC